MKIAALICLCSVVALLAVDDSTQVNITKDTASTFYRTFKRLTKQPHHVAPLTAILCASPSPELIEQERRATGPHFSARVHIYANALADDAITRKLYTFPTGAVVIKEKLAKDDSVSGVGGMIKRAPGFDPRNGDWEYFYSEKTAGFSIGRLKSCIECHAGTKGTDYIYSVWKPFE